MKPRRRPDDLNVTVLVVGLVVAFIVGMLAADAWLRAPWCVNACGARGSALVRRVDPMVLRYHPSGPSVCVCADGARIDEPQNQIGYSIAGGLAAAVLFVIAFFRFARR